MGLNFRWLQALGSEAAAPYELVAHPLGSLKVYPHSFYSIRVRARMGERVMPTATAGVLVLGSDLRGGIAELDRARPFTPVVLIDGEPALTGFGSGDVDLAPGVHLLEVQTGASGAYWPIDVKAGRFTRMTSFVKQRLDDGSPIEMMRQSVLIPTRAMPPRMGRLASTVLAAVAGVAAFGLTAVALESMGVPFPDSVGLRMLIFALLVTVGIVGAVFGHRAGVLIEQLWNRIAEARLMVGLPVAEHAERPCPGGRWRPVDPRDEAPPRGLRLNLAYVQTPHQPQETPSTILDEDAVADAAERARRFGEDYPPQIRPWVAPPRVLIDGEPVPAIWGVNEYRLSPGSHRVELAVPPPPEALLDTETEVELGPESRIDVEVSDAGAVDALARIEMTPSWDGDQLQRYSGRFEQG